MEAIIFCGIQATGKTTFYSRYFFKTHLRISLDLLHTRNKEDQFLETCYRTRQRFVVDNTNLTKALRLKYITGANEAKFKVTGYFFESSIHEALKRNSQRTGKESIPEKGIWSSLKKLESPAYEDGFDQLYVVQIKEGDFAVENWSETYR